MKNILILTLLACTNLVYAQQDTIIYEGPDRLLTSENALRYLETTTNEHGVWQQSYTRSGNKWTKENISFGYELLNDTTLYVTAFCNGSPTIKYQREAVLQKDGLYLIKQYFESGRLNFSIKSSHKYLICEEGIMRTYFPEGSLRSIGNYVHHRKEGKHLEYNQAGDIIKEVDYNTGQIVTSNEDSLSGESIESVAAIVDKWPLFPGGQLKMEQYFSTNLIYPIVASKNNIQGRVYVSFVVEKNGSLTEIQILRGIGGGCDEEALRVVDEMPNWIPGEFRGEQVRVRMNLPMIFKLKESKN